MTWSDVANQLLTDASQRRAERLVKAQAMQGLALSWTEVNSCPAWVATSDDGRRERLCASAGAWWLAASLRACIDGKRVARIRDLLGDESLAELRDSPTAQRAEALNQAPRPLLPPAEAAAEHLLACGRALLGWSLPADVRGPVLKHLGWVVDERHFDAFEAHEVWARQALRAALQPVPDSEPVVSTNEDTEAVG